MNLICATASKGGNMYNTSHKVMVTFWKLCWEDHFMPEHMHLWKAVTYVLFLQVLSETTSVSVSLMMALKTKIEFWGKECVGLGYVGNGPWWVLIPSKQWLRFIVKVGCFIVFHKYECKIANVCLAAQYCVIYRQQF